MSPDELAATAADAVRCLTLPNPVVLIDGPSGAGKSTLATLLADVWPLPGSPQVIRMDELYPGWGGLDAASASLPRDLLAPLATGRAGRWRRYDWALARSAEWHTVEAGTPLIVEGCGAISRASAPLGQLRLWLEADDEVRRARALARDAGGFDVHWEMWQRQFERFVERERPRQRCDLVLNATPRAAGGAPDTVTG